MSANLTKLTVRIVTKNIRNGREVVCLYPLQFEVKNETTGESRLLDVDDLPNGIGLNPAKDTVHRPKDLWGLGVMVTGRGVRAFEETSTTEWEIDGVFRFIDDDEYVTVETDEGSKVQRTSEPSIEVELIHPEGQHRGGRRNICRVAHPLDSNAAYGQYRAGDRYSPYWVNKRDAAW